MCFSALKNTINRKVNILHKRCNKNSSKIVAEWDKKYDGDSSNQYYGPAISIHKQRPHKYDTRIPKREPQTPREEKENILRNYSRIVKEKGDKTIRRGGLAPLKK